MTFALRRDAIGLLIAFGMLLTWDASGFDLLVSRALGSASGFAWRAHWLTAGVLHEGGRVAGWVALAAAMTWRGLPWRVRGWWLATTLACVLFISLLKAASSTSCPWSLAEFGGVARYVSHWQFGVTDGGGGRCFPSGHAASAFALLPGAYALAGATARRWLAAVLLAGALLGMAQVMRGAHYASHVLWTGWWCWLLSAVSHHGTSRWRATGASFTPAGCGTVP